MKHLFQTVKQLHASPDWPDFAGGGWADTIMDVEVTDREHRKQGRAIARWTLTAQDGRTLVVYLKRHFRLSRVAGLLALLCPWKAWSPGLQEWEHLVWAQSQGIPVPRPIAAGELVGPWGRLQGFLAVEELTGMLALHEAIPLAQQRLTLDAFNQFKRTLSAEMARLTQLLHGRHVFHKDLYLCHFYIHEDDTTHPPTDWRNRVFVIDLHRLGSHPLTRWWWRIKDLAQLLYSSDVVGVTPRDRVRFWRQYLAGASGWWSQGLAKLIRWKGLRYTKHNRKGGTG